MLAEKTQTLKKISCRNAADVAAHFEVINQDAANYLDKQYTPEQYLDILVEHGLYEDAILFLAHCLPKREAIWWGCVCTRNITSDKASADDLACLQFAEKWVYQPDETYRRLCGVQAEKGGYKSAQNWVAAAVFWSGGSIIDEGEPVVEPAPYLYAHAVSGAILTAVGSVTADKIEEYFKSFLQHGLNIADGGNG